MTAPLERLTDAQRTVVLRDLLGACHVRRGNGTPATEKVMAAREVFLSEVADGTGFARGYADAVAVSVWPSEFGAEGYEIKASRADLKRELSDLSKWERIGRYCTKWWLVVWDRRWLEDDRIPASWGLLAYSAETADLETVRNAREQKPDPWPNAFIAALIRRAAEASPSAALLERMREIGYSRGVGDGSSSERSKHEEKLKPLLEAYRATPEGQYAWRVPLEWVIEQVKKAAPAVTP